MTTRRRFLAATGSTLAFPAVTSAQPKPAPVLSFGLMADCQYADVAPAGVRFYRESPRKLKEAVEELNKHDLAFTFHLGDFIDRDFKSFEVLEPIVGNLKSKLYHALGNHDFDVADDLKSKIPERLGLKSGYYSFASGEFRFLVLDTTEFSVYSHPKDSPLTTAARAELKKLQEAKAVSAQPWNSRPGDAQLSWLEEQLKSSTGKKETVLIFGHHPVLPLEGHAVWNAPALDRLFQNYPCAKAYLNGHNHAGAYTDEKGFHYLTLDGMLDTKDKNAFAFAALSPTELSITGFGRQESHVLKFR